MSTIRRLLRVMTMPIVLGAWAGPAGAADQLRIEYSFASGTLFPPVGPVVGYHTPGQPLTWALYGTYTYNLPNAHCPGGYCGVVFKLLPPPPGTTGPWTETDLYDFRGLETPPNNDGMNPQGPLAFDRSGAIYGGTQNGGTAGAGTIYKLTPPAAGKLAWKETILYNFQAGNYGESPIVGVILDASGAIYGTADALYSTPSGNAGGGVVFKLTPPVAPSTGWTYAVLHSFSGPEGEYPKQRLVMDAAGALYGSMSEVEHPGGDRSGNVFRLTPPVSPGGIRGYEIIYPFANGEGEGLANSSALILDPAGSLYGITDAEPGSVYNTVFRLDPPAAGGTTWRHTVLYSFTSGEGAPSGIIAIGGALYGVTDGSGGTPTVFKLTPPVAGQGTWTLATVYSFPSYPYDSGAVPGTLERDSRGNVYGITGLSQVFKVFTGTLPH